jgi:hypothetical protein
MESNLQQKASVLPLSQKGYNEFHDTHSTGPIYTERS